jgi:cysteinyl-tRNA synthetase
LKQLGVARVEVDELVNQRQAARAQKNFALADELRTQLTKKGISVQDTGEGSVWEVEK